MIFLIWMFLLAAACGAAIFGAWARLRRERVGVVVQTLASVVSQALPLPTALRAAATAERRALRKLFSRLAHRIELGDELSLALSVSLPACPAEVIGALQGAERGGTTPGVLQALAARLRSAALQPAAASAPLWYPLLMSVMVPAVLAFIALAVAPRWLRVFEDFDVALPRITEQLLSLLRPARDAPLVSLAVLAALALAVLQAAAAPHFFRRKPERLQLRYVLWDALAWSVPGLRRLAEHGALGQQLVVMHASIRGGHSLIAAARHGASAATNCCARRRLIRWANAMEAGAEPGVAAQRVGLPSHVAGALRSPHGAPELAARLEYLASYYAGLHRHWRRVLNATLTPLMVAAWAALVGYVVVALYLPLVALYESVLHSVV